MDDEVKGRTPSLPRRDLEGDGDVPATLTIDQQTTSTPDLDAMQPAPAI
jgi:hypothetical protein